MVSLPSKSDRRFFSLSHAEFGGLRGAKLFLGISHGSPHFLISHFDRKSGNKKRYTSKGGQPTASTQSPGKMGKQVGVSKTDLSRTTYGSRMVSRQKPSRKFLKQNFPEMDYLQLPQVAGNRNILQTLRAKHRCSQCRSEEHTLRRCPEYLGGRRVLMPHDTLVPGEYAFYKSRFHDQTTPVDVIPVTNRDFIRVHDVVVELFETTAIREIQDMVARNYLNFEPPREVEYIASPQSKRGVLVAETRDKVPVLPSEVTVTEPDTQGAVLSDVELTEHAGGEPR